MPNDRDLKFFYRRFNKKFFHNQLPNNLTVRFASPAQFTQKGLGKRTCAITLIEDGKAYAIIVKKTRGKTWAYIKADLLHEMVHVKNPRLAHGPRFQKEMLRLAQIGAFKGIW
jgi:hypothetical protein